MRNLPEFRHAPKLRVGFRKRPPQCGQPRQGKERATRRASVQAPGKWDQTIYHHTHLLPSCASRLLMACATVPAAGRYEAGPACGPGCGDGGADDCGGGDTGEDGEPAGGVGGRSGGGVGRPGVV